ncbi:TPA: Rpn family recombination-promoting nuclease/putative transposase, partial [Providencia alcalifaciens]
LQEKGRQEGLLQDIEQGFEKGIEKGRKEERVLAYQRQLNMARNLLKNGVSLELIVESTGLSREELTSLQ